MSDQAHDMARDAVRNRLVFTDLETLGLRNDSPIVEIGMVICAPDLQIIEQRSWVVSASDAAWAASPNVVQEMHGGSGLMAESLEAYRLFVERGIDATLGNAEHDCIEMLSAHGFKQGDAVIAGNSIGQDRIWIATQMPHLNDFLSYRTIDVSAVRGLIQRWALPGYSGPKGETAHRALPDALWSRSELALYRRALFTGREADIADCLTGSK